MKEKKMSQLNSRKHLYFYCLSSLVENCPFTLSHSLLMAEACLEFFLH